MSNKDEAKPYKIETSPNNRASCKSCREKIVKETVRIGVPTPYTTPDGKTVYNYKYFHLKCIPRKHADSVLAIDNINDIIQSEDIELLSTKSKENNESPQRSSSSRKGLLTHIEVSKSSRAKCIECEDKILKDTFRYADPKPVELDDGRKFTSYKYTHIECFLKTKVDKKTELNELIETSVQNDFLSESDAAELLNQLKSYLEASDVLYHDFIINNVKEDPISLEDLIKIAKKNSLDEKLLRDALKQSKELGEIFEVKPKHYILP